MDCIAYTCSDLRLLLKKQNGSKMDYMIVDTSLKNQNYEGSSFTISSLIVFYRHIGLSSTSSLSILLSKSL